MLSPPRARPMGGFIGAARPSGNDPAARGAGAELEAHRLLAPESVRTVAGLARAVALSAALWLTAATVVLLVLR